MKYYIIWLKGGGSIDGTMDDAEVERLKEFAKRNDPDIWMNESAEEFTDTEGTVLLYRSSIEAVAFNKKLPEKEYGFTRK